MRRRLTPEEYHDEYGESPEEFIDEPTAKCEMCGQPYHISDLSRIEGCMHLCQECIEQVEE